MCPCSSTCSDRKGSPRLARPHPEIPTDPGKCLHSTGPASCHALSGGGFPEQLPPTTQGPGLEVEGMGTLSLPWPATLFPLPTGNMLLCLSPAWLTKVPAPGQSGEAVLLVSKAVSFHPGGLTFLDDFVPPRRATYFLAGLGLGPGRGREAAELARDLTCPTGASAELARLLEDRLLTRRLLAQQGGVAVPATLAFTYKPPALLRGGEASPGLRLVELSGKEGQETLVKEEVGAFLHSGALGDALQVTGSRLRGLCRCQQDGTQGWLPGPAAKLSPALSHTAGISLCGSPLASYLRLHTGSSGTPQVHGVVRRPPSPPRCRWLSSSVAGAGGGSRPCVCTREGSWAQWRTRCWRCWRNWRRRRVSWWRLCAHLPDCPSQVRAPGASQQWELGSPSQRLCAGLRFHCLSPGSPPPGPELAVRICAVVCRTQGDRPLLSKVSLAQV